jgi:hypothetical protein
VVRRGRNGGAAKKCYLEDELPEAAVDLEGLDAEELSDFDVPAPSDLAPSDLDALSPLPEAESFDSEEPSLPLRE